LPWSNLPARGRLEAVSLYEHTDLNLLLDVIRVHELLNEAESFADGSGTLAATVMPAIGDTTEVILAYEEKYGAGQYYPETLERDLSALGEVLESRFVMEDRLIAGLHNSHRRQAEDLAPE
jgi:regulator of sigma D